MQVVEKKNNGRMRGCRRPGERYCGQFRSLLYMQVVVVEKKNSGRMRGYCRPG